MTRKPGSLNFSGKLNHVRESIFTEMSRYAQDYDALNLSQGFPDFSVDPQLIDKVHHYMKQGDNQYAPMAGALPLRQAIVDFSKELYQADYDARTEITITAGATQALSTAIGTTVREGDEVLLFSPAYDAYIPLIELQGGRPITVKLEHPDYSIDWQQVKRLINHRTRMIMLNTPHNPSGSVWSEKDLDALEEIVDGSSILVLSDEVYEHIVFNGEEHRSLRTRPKLRSRTFVVGSLGKSLHVTGWKIGYCLAPELLMNEFQKVHQFEIFSVNHPVQLAMADYLQEVDLKKIGGFYEAKQKVFLEAIKNGPFKPLPTYGSYFQLLDYSEVSQEHDQDFAKRLTREHKVAAIPLSPFYRDPTDHKVLRFCFAKDEETLWEAGRRLAELA